MNTVAETTASVLRTTVRKLAATTVKAILTTTPTTTTTTPRPTTTTTRLTTTTTTTESTTTTRRPTTTRTTAPPTTTTTTTTPAPTTTTTTTLATTTTEAVKLKEKIVKAASTALENVKDTFGLGEKSVNDTSSISSIKSQYQCDRPFAFECDEMNCCEAYQVQIYVLIVALTIILLAILTLIIFIACRRRNDRKHAEQIRRKSQLDVERTEHDKLVNEHTAEETLYLRRMSLIHQYPVRHPDDK